MMYRQLTSAKRSSLRNVVLATTSLSIWVVASSVALAGAPATGSLPGSFSTNQTGTTYAVTGTTGTAATITIQSGTSTTPAAIATPSVIQFGGTALPTSVSAPTGLSVATNPGFSIGSGATLNITNGAATEPTLVNDESGNPSQIYGALNASALGGPLFVANANGVVVGASGTITAPSTGVGLLGYAADSGSFATVRTLTVNSTTVNGGDVTVTAGSTVSGGTLLVAGNGAVNVGIGGPVDVVAGYGFSTIATSVTPAVSTALPNSTATVNFSGGSTATPIDVLAINAVGAVNNSGILTLPATGIGGTFTNSGSGVVNVAGLTAGAINNAGVINDTAGTLTAVGVAGATSGADITNSGVINESTAALTLSAGQVAGGATGNVTNSGVIAFTTAGTNSLNVSASNIDFGGSVQQATASDPTPTALSATNALGDFVLKAIYNAGTVANPNSVLGVVDYASTVYSQFFVAGQAVRVLSGSLISPAAVTNGPTHDGVIEAGSGSATDPFFNNAKLGYNLSVFPNALVEANNLFLSATTGKGSSETFGNINLDGVVSDQVAAPASSGITAIGNNINAGSAGGFAVNSGDTLGLFATGNVNNPNGATNAGSTAFQYNFVPVTVGSSSTGGTGTVTLALTDLGYGALSSSRHPNSTIAPSTTAQNVNVLVNGNAILSNDLGVPTTVGALTTTSPISPAASYVNNHLVVQSTGNIQVGSAAGTFYWPGLVYLSNVTSAASPMTLSSAGSITLGSTAASGAFKTNLNNIIPALVPGGAGVFFETNNLTLNGGTVSTNDNAWVNFASAKIASAFQLTQSASFFGGYTDNVTSTVTELGLQSLPTSDYQPAN